MLAFCHLIFLLFLVICEIGFGVRRYLNEPEMARAVQTLEAGATQRTVTEKPGVSRSVVALDYGYYSKNPEGTEGDLSKDMGEQQQRFRIIISGTWHVVILGLRLECFRMISC